MNTSESLAFLGLIDFVHCCQ